MNRPLKNAVLCMIASLFGGAVGGLCGMALGLNSPVMELSSANFRAGLMGGTFLGLFPTILIGILTLLWRRSASPPALHWLGPPASFVLNGLLITGLVFVQVGPIAAC